MTRILPYKGFGGKYFRQRAQQMPQIKRRYKFGVWEPENEGRECTKHRQWSRQGLSMSLAGRGKEFGSILISKDFKHSVCCSDLDEHFKMITLSTFQGNDWKRVKRGVVGPVGRQSGPAETGQWCRWGFEQCQWEEVARFGIQFKNQSAKTRWINVRRKGKEVCEEWLLCLRSKRLSKMMMPFTETDKTWEKQLWRGRKARVVFWPPKVEMLNKHLSGYVIWTI